MQILKIFYMVQVLQFVKIYLNYAKKPTFKKVFFNVKNGL